MAEILGMHSRPDAASEDGDLAATGNSGRLSEDSPDSVDNVPPINPFHEVKRHINNALFPDLLIDSDFGQHDVVEQAQELLEGVGDWSTLLRAAHNPDAQGPDGKPLSRADRALLRMHATKRGDDALYHLGTCGELLYGGKKRLRPSSLQQGLVWTAGVSGASLIALLVLRKLWRRLAK